jgi:nitrogen fixation protein FixH
MTTPKNKVKKSKIPYFFFIFFGIFITVDLFYIYIAHKNWRGIATENSYEKGLKYNQTIKAKKEQENLGWQLQIKYQKITSKQGDLKIKLLDKNGQSIKNAKIKAKITRPTQDGYDFKSNLTFNSKEQNYQSYVKFPLIGQWDVEIIAQKNDNFFQDLKRFVIQ